MPELGVQVNYVGLRGDRLLIQAEAPSLEMKNRVWDQITIVDPTYPDLLCNIVVNPSMPMRVASPALIDAEAASLNEDETYVIQAGDTLAGISHRFYGDAGEGRKILDVNRDQIDDPERLQAGVILRIPR